MMALTLGMSHSLIEPDRSVLGDIVRELYRFAYEGEYKPSYKMVSPSKSNEEVIARDFVAQIGSKSFVVKPDHLPFDPHVRAVLVRNGHVLLETSRIDFNELETALNEYGSHANVKGTSLFYNDTQIIKTRTQNALPGSSRIDMRTLTKIIAPYASEEWNGACSVIDCMDQDNTYHTRYLPESIQQSFYSGTPKLDLIQEPQLLQEMQQLQTPKLAVLLSQNFLRAMKLQHFQRLKRGLTELRNHVNEQLKHNPALEESKEDTQ